MTNWDNRFLELAKQVSSWSKDPSTQVGAVIVRPDRTVASTGFNGFPMAMPDSEHNLLNREEKYSRVIHAEMNALIFSREDIRGYTLYTHPFIPCDRCFVHLVQAGIIRFVSPKCPPEKAERWGTSFDRVRNYAKETLVEIVEL